MFLFLEKVKYNYEIKFIIQINYSKHISKVLFNLSQQRRNRSKIIAI